MSSSPNDVTTGMDLSTSLHDDVTLGPNDSYIAIEYMYMHSLTLHLTAGLYLPILILGLPGNILSFIVLFPHAKSSSTYCYLCALCVYDSVFLATSVLSWGMYGLSDGAIDLRRILDCNLLVMLIDIPRDCSTWLLVAISVERLLVVYFPTKSKQICRVKRSLGIIAAITVAMCAVNWNAFGGYVTLRGESSHIKGTACAFRSKFLQYYFMNIMQWLQATVYSYVPSLIMSITNIAIIVKFRQAAIGVDSAKPPATKIPVGGYAKTDQPAAQPKPAEIPTQRLELVSVSSNKSEAGKETKKSPGPDGESVGIARPEKDVTAGNTSSEDAPLSGKPQQSTSKETAESSLSISGPTIREAWGTIPGGAIPGGDIPGGDIPGGDIPGGDIPGGDIPGGAIPGGAIRGGDIPGGDIPGGDILEGDIPGGDIPGGAIPGRATAPDNSNVADGKQDPTNNQSSDDIQDRKITDQGDDGNTGIGDEEFPISKRSEAKTDEGEAPRKYNGAIKKITHGNKILPKGNIVKPEAEVKPKKKLTTQAQGVPAASRTMAKKSKRMTIMCTILTSAFLLLTLPNNIHNIHFNANIPTYNRHPKLYYQQMIIRQTLSALLHLNHGINFLLYCATSTNFRKRLVQLFARCKVKPKLK